MTYANTPPPRHRPRVGLLTGGLGTYWAQFEGMLDGISESSAHVTKQLEAAGVNVVDMGVVSDAFDGNAAAQKLVTESCDVLVIFVATYMTSGQIVSITRECGIPVLLLELQPEMRMQHTTATTQEFLRYAGVAGLPEICNVFDRTGVNYDVIVGWLGDEGVWTRVAVWLRAAAAVGSLRYARFGLMGHLYPGMLDIQTNMTSLIRGFGGNFDVLEIDDLRVAVEQVTDEEVEATATRTQNEFELLPGCSQDHLQLQIRVAAGLNTLIRQRKLNGLAYFHFGRGGDAHEQVAGAMAIGGTFGITDGVPVGTEFDLRAVIAMYILNQLSDSGSMFTELYSVNYADGVVEVGHDGATNVNMTVPRPKIKPLAVFHGKTGSGNAVESTARPGPVTHLALAEMGDGSIRMVVGEGTVVPGPLMSIGNSVSRVDFGCDPARWVEAWSKSGSGHHFGMAAGHHAAELRVLAHLLKIEYTQLHGTDLP